jgi:hypothetical protein
MPQMWKSTKVPKVLKAVEKDNDWNNLFAETVDDTLKQIFKEDGARVIYKFLENQTCLKLEEVADNPKVFSASLERLMVSAARVIEKVILKNLYSKIGLKFKEKQGYEFSDYIRELREA